jgi:acylglycerol lipase
MRTREVATTYNEPRGPNRSITRYWYLCLLLAALTGSFCAFGAQAKVLRLNHADFENQHFDYVYEWSDPEIQPVAIAVAIHGLSMHGLVYDSLARHLAKRGVIVYAPDLRGYGRWRREEKVDYDKSRADLLDLITTLKSHHQNLPLYCLGESMGAGFAMFAAAEKPSCVDGLILSSPAIKRRLHIFPRLVLDVCEGFALPTKELSMVPYIKYFASDDRRILEEKLNDPLVRKRLSLADLYKTQQTIRPILRYAERIEAKTPVLIIQGKDDRMLCAPAVVELMAHLNSSDDTVKWFKNKGHLILETSYLQTDTLDTIDGWLDRVTQNPGERALAWASYEINDRYQENDRLALY